MKEALTPQVKVSVVMCTYNGEKYLREQIESILNQTFKDWEMLIIDDGSTDDSLAVCRIFEDPRIHVISTENGGGKTVPPLH